MTATKRNWSFAPALLVIAAVTLVVGASPSSRVEMTQSDARWKPLRYFEGIWKGTGDGISGTSRVDRAYRFVLDGHFLHVTTKAVFPAQEKNPKGDVHQDWGMISLDTGRDKFMLREFHTEQFVNTYALELSDDGKRFVFNSEHIENMPADWRGRLTITKIDGDSFEEKFELAPPGEAFFTCVHNKLRRSVTTRE